MANLSFFPKHGLMRANFALKENADNLEDCGVFSMAWQSATRKEHQANVSAEMFCAQLQA